MKVAQAYLTVGVCPTPLGIGEIDAQALAQSESTI